MSLGPEEFLRHCCPGWSPWRMITNLGPVTLNGSSIWLWSVVGMVGRVGDGVRC